LGIAIFWPALADVRKARKFLKYFLISFVIVLVVFSPWLHAYFVSDDWPVILRNMQITWREIPDLFTGMRFGWYRPVFEVYVALCWSLFGPSPFGYRLLGVILYSFVSSNVGIMSYLLADDERVGVLATVVFSVFAPHAEPVLWFAANNELLAGLFISFSLISYILFRRTNNGFWFIICVLECFLGIASKETSLFFPFMLLVYDVLFIRLAKNRRFNVLSLWPSLVIVVLGVVFVFLRVSKGSNYSVQVTVPRLAMNLVYYVLIGILALPGNYALQASLPLWRASPILPVVVLGFSACSLLILLWVWIREQGWLLMRCYKKPLLFSLVWTVGALVPVILIVSVRTVFTPSMGIVMILSILFVGAWDVVRKNRRMIKLIVLASIILCVLANVVVLRYRCTWWGRASEVSKAVFTQLDSEMEDLPIGSQILLLGLPDYLEYAYTFRNAFPAAAEVLGYGHDVKAVIDTELAELTPLQQEEYIARFGQDPNAVILWYVDGKVVSKED
jgi:hypothetical protein